MPSQSPALPSTAAAIERANRLADEAFPEGRHARSSEYLSGVRSALLARIAHQPIQIPFSPGTAQADAFQAGFEEGKRIAARQADL